MKIPALLKFVLLVVIAYLVFKAPALLMGKPIPASLAGVYLFFTVVVILLVMTSTDKGVSELTGPIYRVSFEPGLRPIRNVIVVALPIIAVAITYFSIAGGEVSSVKLRTAHPAPPETFAAYGKRVKTEKLTNPYRALEESDPRVFERAVKDGGKVYFKNCFFCHGAKLDGAGHYARALKNPLPQPFKGQDTIAQLSEAYLFWRITTGGPGLPAESAPWDSSMPAWESILSEDEIWKVILFVYDYTGNRPRSWE